MTDDDDDYTPPSDMDRLRHEVAKVTTNLSQIALWFTVISGIIVLLLALILWRVW